MRLHVVLDDELVAELDRHGGARQRRAPICLDTFHVVSAESNNASIGHIRANARGVHDLTPSSP